MPVLTSPAVHRRDRAIRLTVAASVAAKAVSIGCTLLQVPIAVRYLGGEAYGLWVTLVGIVLILNFVDFGLGVGMQHAMAKDFGNDNMPSMRRMFWTGAAVLSALGFAVLVAGLPLAFLRPWADTFHLRDPALRAFAPRAFAIAVAAFVVGLPFNAVSRLAAAVQRGWIHAGWIAAGSLLSLTLVAAAAAFRWGFLGFLAASLCVPIVQGTGLLLHLHRALRWPLRPPGLAPASEIRGMLRSSACFAFPQLGLALVQSAPALAISISAGAAAVTGYNLLIRLFSPFQQGQLVLLTPVWPAYTEARVRGDHAWIRGALRRSWMEFFALGAGVAAVAWASRPLLRLWVGPSAGPLEPGLAAVCAAWCILQMAAQPCVYFLTGIGRLRTLAARATPGLLLASAALFAHLGPGTARGVLTAGSVVLAALLLPPLAWASGRAVRRPEP